MKNKKRQEIKKIYSKIKFSLLLFFSNQIKRISTTLWYFLSVLILLFHFAFIMEVANSNWFWAWWVHTQHQVPYFWIESYDNALFDNWNSVAIQVSTLILKLKFEHGSFTFSLGSISMCCFCACISKVWNFFPISFFIVIMPKCVCILHHSLPCSF